MSRNDTTVQEQLKALKWSLDDLFIRIIIISYKRIENDIKKQYPRQYNKQKELISKEISKINITRQTLYNIANSKHKHKTTLEKASLIRDVINEGRREIDNKSEDLDFAELDIIIY